MKQFLVIFLIAVLFNNDVLSSKYLLVKIHESSGGQTVATGATNECKNPFF